MVQVLAGQWWKSVIFLRILAFKLDGLENVGGVKIEGGRVVFFLSILEEGLYRFTTMVTRVWDTKKTLVFVLKVISGCGILRPTLWKLKSRVKHQKMFYFFIYRGLGFFSSSQEG